MATAAKTTKQPAAAGPETKGLRIVAKREGFRRAGHAFGSEPLTIPLSKLTPDEVEQLENDRMLVVVRVDIEPVAEAKE